MAKMRFKGITNHVRQRSAFLRQHAGSSPATRKDGNRAVSAPSAASPFPPPVRPDDVEGLLLSAAPLSERYGVRFRTGFIEILR